MPYTCLDDRKDFGIGIHLYFYFIKFCFIINFISLCLSSIPTMVFSIRYTNHLIEHCRIYYNDVNYTFGPAVNNKNSTLYNQALITNNSECLKYLSTKYNNQINEDLETVVRNDWILKMSADNVKNYFKIFKEKAGSSDNIDNILIDFSFIYFLTSITLLIINFFFIHYVNVINDKDDFQETTPRDFTILVHGVKRQKNNKNILREETLRNILNEISNNYFKLDIYQIIPCYNLVKLYKLTKKVFEDRIKIYHVHNFKRQKDLNKKYRVLYDNKSNYQTHLDKLNSNNDFNNNDSIKGNVINQQSSQLSMIINNIPTDNLTINKYQNIENNLNYYSKFACYVKATPVNIIEERIKKNKEKIKEIEEDLSINPNKYNCGTYFVVFKYISMRDKIYDFFPTNFISKVFLRIKYFFQNILFGYCVSEKTKRLNYLKTTFTVEHATEAYEILWQNLGYSLKEKYGYLFLSFIITIILIGISLCIVIGLNEIQFTLTEKGTDKVTFWKYLISLLISIVIAIINSLGRKILKIVTSKFEAIETRTDYYISLSVKISIFTFINTAIVPLLSNYIRGIWGKNDILLNNVLLIFIVNITLTPFTFYFNPNLWLKISRRAKARLDLEGVPLEESKYTQRQLNQIFENPSMDLGYKYSYLENILLTSLFYMSIFPIGTIFSFVALILTYFLEIYYLGFYKRPELLNARLCKFFIQNFKIAISIFCIGNYIFLGSIRKYNWSFINFIVFIVIAFIPYHSIKINLIGTTEGETSKGSYEEYYLMFPTDYEKQNPLTKKSAMIKYFKKLEELHLIDKFQSQFLINDIQKESTMDNYYKTSKNISNVLNSYEFQRQFVKFKRKYKFIKEFRKRQRKVDNDKYVYEKDKDIDKRFRIRGFSGHIKRSSGANNYINQQLDNLNKDINITTNNIIKRDSEQIDENSCLGYNQNYDINIYNENDNYKKRKVNAYMRKALFKRIKDEGILSDTEEESEDESFESESFKITSGKIDNIDEKSSSSNYSRLIKSKESNSELGYNKMNNNTKIYAIKEDIKNEDDDGINSIDAKRINSFKINKDFDLNINKDKYNKPIKAILRKRAMSNENIFHNKVSFNLQK